MRRIILFLVLIVIVLAAWLAIAPPRFVLNQIKAVDLSDPVAAGQQLVEKYNCRSCHRIGGEGALKAPNLAGITQRVNDPAQVTLRLWLRNPKAVRSNTAMPNFRLSDSEIEAILAYLSALDSQESQ